MNASTIGALGAVIVVVLAIMSMNTCSVRNHDFRIACINRGGIYLDRGGSADCIVNGKISDLKSE